MKPNEFIPMLKKDKRLYGTCPCCNEEFRLGSAHLFSLKGPFPQQALDRIAAL